MSNKEFLRQTPFIRLVFPLILGIVIRINFSIPDILVFSLLLITLLVTFCFTISERLSINYKYRWVPGLSIHLIIFCLAVLYTERKLQSFTNYLNEIDTPVNIIGIISEPPEIKPNSVQCFITVDQVFEKKKFAPCKDKILVYIQKDNNALELKAGDAMIMRLQLNKIKCTGNPYEFDYKKFLSYQGIYLSGYVNRRSWDLLTRHKLPVYQMMAFNVRAKLLSIFARIGLSGDELGVASALIIGDKTNLDADIKQAYVASGTMHILAVSGMHVALLYWVLNMLLSFMDRNKHGKLPKMILLLLAIWFYALITGLGGSILRAATMISFIIIGQSFSRHVHIFNSLAISAFFLLMINPFNLIDVGFQLSYAAVISIVICYPLIYKMMVIKDWWCDQIWSLMAVTIAAQILTTPVSLFYFHQFPNLFLISNLIMIPLSTLIMYFVMMLIPLSGLSWLSNLMGKILDFLVWLLNKVVFTIEHLPFALTKGAYITWLDICFLYLLICFVALYILKRKPLFLMIALSAIVLLLGHGSITEYQNLERKEIVVYSDTRNFVIQFRKGNQCTWIVGEKNLRVERYMDIAIQAGKVKENRVYLLDSIKQQSWDKGIWLDPYLWIRGHYVQFFNKKIIICDVKETARLLACPMKTDYLIVNEIKESILYELKDRYKPGLVIMNTAISVSKARRIERAFAEKNIPTYSIDKSGAWILNVRD